MAGLAGIGVVVGDGVAAGASAKRPKILPRRAWAEGLSEPRNLPVEDDVRFLLVHHTQTPNEETRAEVGARLRSIHRFHTVDKGWPDVAYNFFVDGYGRIWEGRAGSLERPVRGDATGGSQGHALLCCFVGDHRTVPPTGAAQDAMVSLLAWLADEYRVDLGAGRTITFRSRGSNKWKQGEQVMTTPIAAHRDMSQTDCPGNAAYGLVTGALAERARRASDGLKPTTASTPSQRSTSSQRSTLSPRSASSPPGAATVASPSSTVQADSGGAFGVADPWWVVIGGGAVVAGAAILALRGRLSS